MRQHEHRLQQACYVYLKRAVPSAFVTSIDAAFEANPIIGALRRARGILAGVPDLHLTWEGRSYWLEVKIETGRLSEAQQRVHDAIKRAGGNVAVVRSIGDVEFQLREWGIPVLATTLTPQEIDARLEVKAAAPRKEVRKRTARPTLSQIRRAEAARFLPK